MAENLNARLDLFHDLGQRRSLKKIFEGIYTALSTQSLVSAALTTGATATPATGAAWVGVVGGLSTGGNNAVSQTPNPTLVQIASGTAMAALVGTVVNATFNVFCYYVNAAGTRSSAMGTAATTLAGVIMPNTPPGNILIGFTIINPTGAGNFVGGTTVLNDAGVVPNAVSVNMVGAVDLFATFS